MVRVLEASRPLIVVGSEADAAESFKKKSNRSRLNRLARGGAVVFERMKAPDELRPFMKDIAAVYDVRQGALGADPPFLSDPRKAQFHLDLLNTPDLLHASILRVDNTFVAGHLGMMGRGVVSVGVLAHSPFFAAHSPGKLLMMFLTQQLARDGFAVLDLTPGGDEWKQRFADRHEVVRRLTISSTGVAGAPRRVAEGTLVLAGKTLRAVGVSPSRVRALVTSAEESWNSGPAQGRVAQGDLGHLRSFRDPRISTAASERAGESRSAHQTRRAGRPGLVSSDQT